MALFLQPHTLGAVTFGPRLSTFISRGALAPSFVDERRVLRLLATGPDQERWLLRMKSYGIFAQEVLGVVRLDLEPEFLPLLLGSEEVRVDLGATFHPLLDLSVPSMGITEALQSPTIPTDVLVAIVDTGIDLSHPDFRNPDGSTRFVAYWDQTYPRDSTTGTFCDSLMIDEGECPNFPEEPIETILPLGHGTHVAGIAGGNHIRYRGLAPSALLIGVRIRFDEAGLVDALGWLERLANLWRKPMVVNLSLGSNEGPHDGSFPSEIAIDRFSGPGRIVVGAAGNEAPGEKGSGGIHVRFSPGAGIFSARAEFPRTSGDESHFELWGDRDAVFEMAVALEEGVGNLGRILSFTPWFTPRSPKVELSLLDNGLPAVDLILAPQETTKARGIRGTLKRRTSPLSNYRYQLWVRNLTRTLDAWVPNRDLLFSSISGTTILPTSSPEGGVEVNFIPGDSAITITLPGTAHRILTATGYITRTQWVSRTGTLLSSPRSPGALIDVASHGPSRDGRLKPEFALPGEYIASSLSTQLSFFPEDFRVDDTHGLLRGTSMAAPHLSGAIALLLRIKPDLTPEGALDLLKNFTQSATPDTKWGYGKLYFPPLSTFTLSPASLFLDQTPPQVSEIFSQRDRRGWVVELRTSELTRAEILFEGGEALSTLRFGERHRFRGSGSPPSLGFRIRLSDPSGNQWLSEPYRFHPRGCGCALWITNRATAPLLFFPLILLFPLTFWLSQRPFFLVSRTTGRYRSPRGKDLLIL